MHDTVSHPHLKSWRFSVYYVRHDQGLTFKLFGCNRRKGGDDVGKLWVSMLPWRNRHILGLFGQGFTEPPGCVYWSIPPRPIVTSEMRWNRPKSLPYKR
jgi:hypothetical protein